MSTIKKFLMGFGSAVVLVFGGFLASDYLADSRPDGSTNPENITADYRGLLAEAEALTISAGYDCANKKSINQQIDSLQKELDELSARKKKWLDNVPPLPEIDPETIITEEEHGRPGSEVPELTSDAPPLPEIDDLDIINPDEYILQMEDSEQKIKIFLEELKVLCREDEQDKKKIVSDKCSDACQRYKDCASFGGDATPGDLNDAYNTCMEECATWPVKMIKCINAVDIKNPNDCVVFLNCQLPQHYEEKYLK